MDSMDPVERPLGSRIEVIRQLLPYMDSMVPVERPLGSRIEVIRQLLPYMDSMVPVESPTSRNELTPVKKPVETRQQTHRFTMQSSLYRRDLLKRCFANDPKLRPTVQEAMSAVHELVQQARGGLQPNVFPPGHQDLSPHPSQPTPRRLSRGQVTGYESTNGDSLMMSGEGRYGGGGEDSRRVHGLHGRDYSPLTVVEAGRRSHPHTHTHTVPSYHRKGNEAAPVVEPQGEPQGAAGRYSVDAFKARQPLVALWKPGASGGGAELCCVGLCVLARTIPR